MRWLLFAVLLSACDMGAHSSLEPEGAGTIPAGGAAAHANQAAAQGTGGSMLTLKQPIDRGDGKLTLEFGSTYFAVDPNHGARVTSLRHAGQELLTLTGA